MESGKPGGSDTTRGRTSSSSTGGSIASMQPGERRGERQRFLLLCEEAQHRKATGNVMNHSQAEADDLFPRRTGIHRHLVAFGECKQIYFMGEILHIL